MKININVCLLIENDEEITIDREIEWDYPVLPNREDTISINGFLELADDDRFFEFSFSINDVIWEKTAQGIIPTLFLVKED